MSSEFDKIKHSKRLHKEEAAIKRQAAIAKEFKLDEKQIHRFAKKHALDCGHPKCGVCSNGGIREDTIQEKRFKQIPLHDEIY